MSSTATVELMAIGVQQHGAHYLHGIAKRLIHGMPVVVIVQSTDDAEADEKEAELPPYVESIPIERMLPGDGVPGEDNAIVKEAAESMTALKDCKEQVDRLKGMLDDLAKHDWEREKVKGVLDAVGSVQTEADAGLALSRKITKSHVLFCGQMARTLRSAASPEEHGHVSRDADVVATGESVRAAFSEFSAHIGALQDALHGVAEQIDVVKEKGSHWLLHPRTHYVWVKLRESLPVILKTVVQIISHIGKILGLVHPVANIISALADAVHAHLSKSDAKGEHHDSETHGVHHEYDYSGIKKILDFIRETMPQHVKKVQDMLKDSYTNMEHPMLKVEDQLGTHYIRMEPEDAKRAAAAWEQVGTRLDEALEAHCRKAGVVC
ncbi:uncharacterized protein C8Q71DRAFT_426481 [Rhodofomes roseus]|uniref:Uncharacterized protein n=1 Tax=Rhodofomes roseus TaxID=34475 RepID=A0ABQ8KSP4_9APHY|nr:uncharacterized protein C8Q71DRAFT_426481 [Rhodofomes roseus]KAH9840851.1 hypothetical protein C8Q71DRAFT_426481 [Rhodofomes roseus]